METMKIVANDWGYTAHYFENESVSFSVVKMFGGKKTSFMFHKFFDLASLLISGRARIRFYDPGEDWFEKIDYNQTMAAHWHDLADVKELVKNEYFSISPGIVYQLEAIEDCEFVLGGNQMRDTDTFELFKGD